MPSRVMAEPHPRPRLTRLAVLTGAGVILAALIWQAVTAGGNPTPDAAGTSTVTAALDIGVLVFREGLECILVLAAITASMTGPQERYRRPVALGVGLGLVATLGTWFVAVRILADVSQQLPALDLQAATGLLAVIVLLVVMNWFFHRTYWTGWITLHNRRKQTLLSAAEGPVRRRRVLTGFAALGFTSLYREGVEVVLFLQSYRLRLGNGPVYEGVVLGVLLSAVVGALTFVAHRKLPYRRMLVLTGVMLGLVLFVMVGEQMQEMQLAHWLPMTRIPWLAHAIPAWMGLWFAVFPTVESLAGQAAAVVLVLGSYALAQRPVASSA